MTAGNLTLAEYARFKAVAWRLVASGLDHDDNGYQRWRIALDEIRGGEDYDERDAFEAVLEVLVDHISDELCKAHGYERASDIVSARIDAELRDGKTYDDDDPTAQ